MTDLEKIINVWLEEVVGCPTPEGREALLRDLLAALQSNGYHIEHKSKS